MLCVKKDIYSIEIVGLKSIRYDHLKLKTMLIIEMNRQRNLFEKNKQIEKSNLELVIIEKLVKSKFVILQFSHPKKPMRCPHFQKVNFQRIKQVRNDEANVQDESHQHMKFSIFSMESLSEDIYNVPEEGIDQVNCLKSKLSNYRYAFNNMTEGKEDPIKENSNIKMPKQMNIKKMITQNEDHTKKSASTQYLSLKDTQIAECSYPIPSPQTSDDGQIPSEHEASQQTRKNPHILVSKASMMTHETFQIFNGIIFLNQIQQLPYECQLKDYVIRISREQKIKYFIELQKVHVGFEFLQDERGIRLEMRCKTKTDVVKVYFISPYQREIFKEVYSNCIKKIKQTRKIKKLLQHDKENSYYSGNFYKSCGDQALSEQESQILNEKSDLHEECISSLSMSSYEGDSLVFETERMTFNQVKDTCNTFDILLFKNKSLMSKVQRIFTNSDYDHTAMLLKTANNQLLMLEATSNSGVAIYTFNSLLRIDRSKYFSRIGLRKYTGDKNICKIARLQNFIRKTVGKKYKFDPMYLIKSQANQHKETFFCSQLVAEALQDAGILSNELPSFKYLPKHFAAENLNSQVIDGRYSETIILE